MKLKLYFKFLLAIALTMTMVSCQKDEIPAAPFDGYIYMPQAAIERDRIQLFRQEAAQDIVFGAVYGGTKLPDQDISVSFKISNEFIAEYNEEHGTDYVELPEESYSLTSLTSKILKGTSSSEPLVFKVFSTSLDQSKKYILPISIQDISDGIINTELSTSYFRIDTIVIRTRDITGLTKVTVSDEYSGGATAGEGSLKLTDNDFSSKFLTFDYSSEFWMQLEFDQAQEINSYSLTSGNDAPERDPKSWKVVASNDGQTWVELDDVKNESFTGRNQTKKYDLPNNEAFKYYRMQIYENGGSSLFQLSEWRVIEFY